MAEMKRKDLALWVVPTAACLLVLGLSLTPLLGGMDKALYDVLLGVKPSPPASDRVLLLDVDGEAIDKVGTWPWPRNLMADGLTNLRELGLDQVVFDIEFLNPSPPGVNRHYLDNDLKRTFTQTFAGLGSDFSDLFTALQSKQITLAEASGYASELVTNTDQAGTALYAKTRQVAQDNDLYLGQALRYFGSAYITLNRQDAVQGFSTPEAETEHRALLGLAAERFSRPFVGSESRSPGYRDFLVPLRDLTTRAQGAGLTNVEIDGDGKRRRIRLFENVGGHWYAQLGLTPLLDALSPSSVEVSDHSLTLVGAKTDRGARNVTIPLDEKGMMLIPWEKRSFDQSFHHVSFYALIDLQRQEDVVVGALADLARRDSWKALAGDNGAQTLEDQYSAWREVRAQALSEGTQAAVQASLQAKKAWMEAVQAFVDGPTAGNLAAAVARQAAGARGAQKELWLAEAKNLAVAQNNLVQDWNAFVGTRTHLEPLIRGKLAYVGYTGTGTTDLGVTPFYTGYPLVGTHANVANAILQDQFLAETPAWWSLVLMVPLSFGLVFVLRNLGPLPQNLTGIGVFVALVAGGAAVFVTTGVFVAMAAPLLVVLLSFVAYALVRFLGTEQEKTFLKKAFSTYLSGEVIDEIVTDPSKLKLGGDQKWMTSMFTDVKGFSTISEKLTATELVHLLNEYLSGMSDIVLNEKGTIDKFEGDAIIAFFGAPLDLPDHASRACLAAIRMRQREAALNPGFLERKMSPVPLLTRIGINTGEMVVGNMGTERKMNYTIMGNAVNLSARLEGVNKQYGTWILTTEFTAQEAGDAFLFRRLDRVRVVGIHTPVRLVNVLGLKAEEGAEGASLVAGFHEALELFEARDYVRAADGFEDLAQRFPTDGPAALYARRSRDFVSQAPAEDWDGVFNLTEK